MSLYASLPSPEEENKRVARELLKSIFEGLVEGKKILESTDRPDPKQLARDLLENDPELAAFREWRIKSFEEDAQATPHQHLPPV